LEESLADGRAAEQSRAEGENSFRQQCLLLEKPPLKARLIHLRASRGRQPTTCTWGVPLPPGPLAFSVLLQYATHPVAPFP